jgi:hypothetical protein
MLFDDVELGGERAGPQQNTEFISLFDGEVAGNLSCATENGRPDDRGGQHLAIQDDGERLAYVFARGVRKTAGARGVEAKVHHGVLRLHINARLGADQIFARNDDLGRQQIRHAFLFGCGIKRGARRSVRRLGFLRRHTQIHELEGEIAPTAEKSRQLIGICEARRLRLNAVEPLTPNERFRAAEIFDAPTDCFKRGDHDSGDPVMHAGFRRLDGEAPIISLDDFKIIGARAVSGMDHRPQFGIGLLNLLRVANRDLRLFIVGDTPGGGAKLQ